VVSGHDDRGRKNDWKLLNPRWRERVPNRVWFKIMWMTPILRHAVYALLLGISVEIVLILPFIYAHTSYTQSDSFQLLLQINDQILGPGVNILFIGWMFIALLRGSFTKGWNCYWLSHSQCPLCMSDMRGRPVEEDGCVVCPKCGAAWKLTDEVKQP